MFYTLHVFHSCRSHSIWSFAQTILTTSCVGLTILFLADQTNTNTNNNITTNNNNNITNSRLHSSVNLFSALALIRSTLSNLKLEFGNVGNNNNSNNT